MDVQITPPTFMHSVGRGQIDPMLFEDGLVCLIFLIFCLCMVNVGWNYDVVVGNKK